MDSGCEITHHAPVSPKAAEGGSRSPCFHRPRKVLALTRRAPHNNRMFKSFLPVRIVLPVFVLIAALGTTQGADNPFLGGWGLTLPSGGAGWLGVEEVDGHLQANLLWGGGSVLPLAAAKIENDRLVLTRNHSVQRKDPISGKNVNATISETITATAQGDELKLTSTRPHEDGQGEDKFDFTGRRVPPMPPAPDLGKVKFGKPIRLFNGKDLTGWRLTDPNAINGWSVKDGLLINNNVHEEGQPRKNYGNLRTDQEFDDFNLKLEVRVPKNGNSGVFLRGMYEVQVMDSYGKPLDSHNMGAVYSRIKPTQSAEKPAGEWQTMDMTFVDRHVTVVLNGKRIIDNQPVVGCTGGALWSDVLHPGPIYLQGDHTSIEYRNILLRPVVK